MYTFHSDAGHGWLAVEAIELAVLGIAGDITHFSYTQDGTVYLEEDQDLATFLKAKLKLGTEWAESASDWWRKHVRTVEHTGDAPIRRMPRYGR